MSFYFKRKLLSPKGLNLLRKPGRFSGSGDFKVECPMLDGKEVLFSQCLRCSNYNDDFESRWSHCRIKEKQQRKSLKKEREEIDRKAAEWQAQREEENRKMREEMEKWRKEIGKRGKKSLQEFQKQEEEYEKKMEEWKEIERNSRIELYGKELVESSKEFIKNMGSEASDEDEDLEEDEEEW